MPKRRSLRLIEPTEYQLAFDLPEVESRPRCEICFRPEHTMRGSLHRDHNHVTGAPRGRGICVGCNWRLLSVLDRAGEWKAKRAIEYLNTYGWERPA